MSNEDNLKVKGKLTIHSGRMIIIDPSYLENFNSEGAEKAFSSYAERLMERENELYQKRARKLAVFQDAMKRSSRSSATDRAKDFEEMIKRGGEWNEECRSQLEQKFNLEIKSSPPYVYQSASYVAFRNSLGDGVYPVVRRKRSIHLLFDYPTKDVGRGMFDLDASKLEGNLLGQSSVDTGQQIIGDAADFKTKWDKSLYCEFETPSGEYTCRFIQDNNVLLIVSV